MDNTATIAQKPAAGFDLSNLDAVALGDEGADCRIINPRDGSFTGIVIRIKGAFAPAFQERLARIRRREAIKQRNAVARAVADEDDDETAKVLAEMTLGWWTVTKEGEEERKELYILDKGRQLSFDRATAADVFTRYPVIRGQVFSFALDTANFTKG